MLKRWMVLLLLLFALPVLSKGANWRQVTGKFARVEFQAPNGYLARYLLTIADGEIPRLAKLHGLSDAQIAHLPRARIILTDKPDISNGYALENSVVIYALSSMYMPFWSEQKNWYRLVLTHELAHWVTFKTIQRKLHFLGAASDLTVPRWFFEGIAQYFAESWNTFRGDLFLKQALLSGNLNTSALQNINNGRLLYATANAFIRYLAAEYGDSAFIRLLRYKPNGWYYDFDKAFKAAFGKTPEDIFPDFVRHAVLYYGNFLANLPVARFPQALPTFIERTSNVFLLSAKDSVYLAAGKEKAIYNYHSLLILRKKAGKVKIIKRLTNRLATRVVLSPDKRLVAFGLPYYSIEENQTAMRFQWHVYDRETGQEKILSSALRSRYGAFDYRNHLYLVEIKADRSFIYHFSPNFSGSDTVYQGRQIVGYVTFTPRNLLIAEIQNPDGQRRLFAWHKEGFQPLNIHSFSQRNPVCLNDRYLVFNELIHNVPVVSVYDFETDSVVSRWADQYGYWVTGVDTLQSVLIAYRYEGDGQPHFYQISLDSLLCFSSSASFPSPNRYGSWQKKAPFLPDTLHILNQGKASDISTSPVLLPHFPMEHLLSFALPFYDQKLGYGVYGFTLWAEALQRQILAAGFWLTPLQMDQSVFLISHSLKAFNTDINTYVYYGPMILSHPEGLRQQVNFSLQRSAFIHGNNRWKLVGKLAYSYFYHHFKDTTRYHAQRVWFNGPSVRMGLSYNLPTAIESAVPKRRFVLNTFYFKTFQHSNYSFQLFENNLMVGSRLFSDDLGFVERFSFIRQKGHLLPFQIVGIDRYYEFDMPREYLFTRTIRGLRENIDTEQLLWNSAEIRYLVKQFTPYKFIFIPIKNVTMDAFFDFARLGIKNTTDVASIGVQISFGDNLMRFSAGYARTFMQGHYLNDAYFARMAVLLNGELF